ncbi:MAG: hypothetical protein ACYSVY_27220 [Planctomycetota bacterium]
MRLAANTISSNPGDWDEDGDVDLGDYGQFPGCLKGPWQAPGFAMPTQDCLDAFDLDADADVERPDCPTYRADMKMPGLTSLHREPRPGLEKEKSCVDIRA